MFFSISDKKYLSMLTVLVFAMAATSSVQTKISEQQIRELQNSYDQAVATGNRAALEGLLADDFSIVHGNGRAQSRAEFAGTARSGLNMKLETSPQAKVTLLGNTAIISGPTEFS